MTQSSASIKIGLEGRRINIWLSKWMNSFANFPIRARHVTQHLKITSYIGHISESVTDAHRMKNPKNIYTGTGMYRYRLIPFITPKVF